MPVAPYKDSFTYFLLKLFEFIKHLLKLAFQLFLNWSINLFPLLLQFRFAFNKKMDCSLFICFLPGSWLFSIFLAVLNGVYSGAAFSNLLIIQCFYYQIQLATFLRKFQNICLWKSHLNIPQYRSIKDQTQFSFLTWDRGLRQRLKSVQYKDGKDKKFKRLSPDYGKRIRTKWLLWRQL